MSASQPQHGGERLLDSSVAIVTGAAGMIGADTARVLCEAGARVMLTDLAGHDLERVAHELLADGHDVMWHAADITDEDDVRRVVAGVCDRHGRIDILDNNAGATGVPGDAAVVDMARDTWRRSLEINALGTMLMCKHVLPEMIRHGGGSIVNISSGQSLRGDLTNSAYSAGKAAVNSLTRDIAIQHGVDGVRCNAVAPGVVVSDPLPSWLSDELATLFAGQSCIPRLGRARDVSNVVLFLASDLAAFVTGQILSVDGGMLSHLPTVAPRCAPSLEEPMS